MRAIRLHEFGPAENLRLEDVPDPQPAAGQVRIRVHAAGVHVVDTDLRGGQLKSAVLKLPQLPTIPGREVAGTVDALGDGVAEEWLGRRVVTHLGMVPGGYAELAVRDVDSVYELPDGLDFPEAVAMIGTGRTTMGILGEADLTEKDVVLVTAAAGGIGNLLVQYAKNLGATVIAAAGGDAKVTRLRELGAHIAVDYTATDWAETVRKELDGRDVTVAFDAVGGDLGRDAFDLLGAGGRFLVYGWAKDTGPTTFTSQDVYDKSLRVSMVLGPRMLARVGLKALEEASLTEAAEGRLKPFVHTFPLADAAAAHRAVESRGTIGKVVLVPQT